MWAALRSLEENVRLSRRMAADAAQCGAAGSAQLHAEVARANEGHADLLRGLMASAPAASEADAAKG